MTPLEQRQLELWRAEMMTRTRWSYADAVLWVAFRDLALVSEWRERSEMAELDKREGALGAAVRIEKIVAKFAMDGNDTAEMLPRTALDVALKERRVAATGHLHKPNGYSSGWWKSDRDPLGPTTWEDHKAVYRVDIGQPVEPPLDAGLELVPRSWSRRPGETMPPHYWTGVEIDRSSLMDVFAAPSPSLKEVWWPGRGQTLTNWCRENGPAEVAARARLKADGNTGPADAHVCEELAQMWNGAHPEKPTTQGSINTLRTRTR